MAGALAALQLDVVEQRPAAGDRLLFEQAVKVGFEMVELGFQPAPTVRSALPRSARLPPARLPPARLPPVRTIKGRHAASARCFIVILTPILDGARFWTLKLVFAIPRNAVPK